MRIGTRLFSGLRRIKRKLLRPRVLRKIVITEMGRARLRRGLPEGPTGGGPAEVYRLEAPAALDRAAENLAELLHERYLPLISGKKVFLKFNLNTADPYPASVCPNMLRAVVDLLRRLGAREVTAGDCSAVPVLPTRRQIKKAGLEEAVTGRARLLCFDNGPWVGVPVGGIYLKRITVPRAALEAECLIALANLKTHREALFSGAQKLAVGFMHPLERLALHREHLQEKCAEIGLAVQPDLVLMDARTVFITGGPAEGLAVRGGTILVGENPLAVDVEAYRLLARLKKEHGCPEGFREDPFTAAQLAHARDLAIWGPWRGYRVIERGRRREVRPQ